MGRRGYPPEFRRRVVDLVASGRSVADVARDLGISAESIYTWRRPGRATRRVRESTFFYVVSPQWATLPRVVLTGSVIAP